ncbi:putative Glycosyl hydrolase family 35 protein [Quillaja saponaria]|uniref:Glycosyl hydrolase family 35 protein n=1 Tax=Quillaja saponaria TaxID=32244 RepID=A0AAD7LPG9_QUISA|nr:putative Glycosyl hydrolase family 35 protein [Quillaja saponaria]
MVSTNCDDSTLMIIRSRKLKENGNEMSDTGNLNLDDYRPLNPVPNIRPSVRPKPIQHGTPLMPIIPKPPPPSHP